MFDSETIFDVAHLQERIRQLEVETTQDSFWENNPNTRTIFQKLSRLKEILAQFQDLKTALEDGQTLLDLAKEEGEQAEIMAELAVTVDRLKSRTDDLELATLLSGPYDSHDGILTINAGAGGTDAQDWAQMLYRMYARWLEKKGYTAEITDLTQGEEAGIKSMTLTAKGPNAYGYLKNEAGVHRLVRISPFNANDKRQTSFAAVDVIPYFEDNEVAIAIDPKDLRVDTFRASGAGGQHVNKTDSAVRITHIPTGLVAQSQAERSQISNREKAMTILKSRLLQKMEAEKVSQLNELRHNDRDIAWGNQIRSYVLHPYSMVKDHRTKVETSNVQAVLDGDLDMFIAAKLRQGTAEGANP